MKKKSITILLWWQLNNINITVMKIQPLNISCKRLCETFTSQSIQRYDWLIWSATTKSTNQIPGNLEWSTMSRKTTLLHSSCIQAYLHITLKLIKIILACIKLIIMNKCQIWSFTETDKYPSNEFFKTTK